MLSFEDSRVKDVMTDSELPEVIDCAISNYNPKGNCYSGNNYTL